MAKQRKQRMVRPPGGWPGRVPRPREEFLVLLQEQLDYIQRSSAAYDRGDIAEAKRLSTQIRILVHDARSPSLLTQMGIRTKIRVLDSSTGLKPQNLLPEAPLTVMQMRVGGGDDSTTFEPRIVNGVEEVLSTGRHVPIARWWNDDVVKDAEGNRFSRQGLVLAVAHTDGGAHVDPGLDPAYHALSRSNSMGWVVVDSRGEKPMDSTPVLPSIRQIAFELAHTLMEQVPGLRRPAGA